MGDSSSFTSLMALVDSHLSKAQVQKTESEGNTNDLNKRIEILSLNKHNGTRSETSIAFSPGQRLNLPVLKPRDDSITNVLAEQVANMLKNKELKKQEEEKKLKENQEQNQKEEEYLIDLTQALQKPAGPGESVKRKIETLSTSSSFESLFEPNFKDYDLQLDRVQAKTPEPILPCRTDMSFIIYEKIKSGKCSDFGKVLTARLKPVAAPYLREKIKTSIKPFAFDTKSPCDLIKEKLVYKPTVHCTFTIEDIENLL